MVFDSAGWEADKFFEREMMQSLTFQRLQSWRNTTRTECPSLFTLKRRYIRGAWEYSETLVDKMLQCPSICFLDMITQTHFSLASFKHGPITTSSHQHERHVLALKCKNWLTWQRAYTFVHACAAASVHSNFLLSFSMGSCSICHLFARMHAQRRMAYDVVVATSLSMAVPLPSHGVSVLRQARKLPSLPIRGWPWANRWRHLS